MFFLINMLFLTTKNQGPGGGGGGGQPLIPPLLHISQVSITSNLFLKSLSITSLINLANCHTNIGFNINILGILSLGLIFCNLSRHLFGEVLKVPT